MSKSRFEKNPKYLLENAEDADFLEETAYTKQHRERPAREIREAGRKRNKIQRPQKLQFEDE